MAEQDQEVQEIDPTEVVTIRHTPRPGSPLARDGVEPYELQVTRKAWERGVYPRSDGFALVSEPAAKPAPAPAAPAKRTRAPRKRTQPARTPTAPAVPDADELEAAAAAAAAAAGAPETPPAAEPVAS